MRRPNVHPFAVTAATFLTLMDGTHHPTGHWPEELLTPLPGAHRGRS